MADFEVNSWRQDDASLSTGRFKRVLYFLARRAMSRLHERRISRATLQNLKPELVLQMRGMPLETRRAWACRNIKIRDAVILVQGTGTGWDVLSWARLRPRRIIAVDLYKFLDSWTEIAAFCKAKLGVPVEFAHAPIETLDFVADGSIDLCGSDSVLEHCKDVGAVLRESHRVLKPGGTFYAGYGPLWFSAGGDHFSGRGGLANVFNHVLLETEDYRRYFQQHLRVIEDYQAGGRYVDLDLFSKLTTAEYLKQYSKEGFLVDGLILELSPDALAFRAAFPDDYRKLERKYQDRCVSDDFVIKTNIVRLTKATD